MDRQTDKWMDTRKDGHNSCPCVLQDIGPLGPLPKTEDLSDSFRFIVSFKPAITTPRHHLTEPWQRKASLLLASSIRLRPAVTRFFLSFTFPFSFSFFFFFFPMAFLVDRPVERERETRNFEHCLYSWAWNSLLSGFPKTPWSGLSNRIAYEHWCHKNRSLFWSWSQSESLNWPNSFLLNMRLK